MTNKLIVVFLITIIIMLFIDKRDNEEKLDNLKERLYWKIDNNCNAK